MSEDTLGGFKAGDVVQHRASGERAVVLAVYRDEGRIMISSNLKDSCLLVNTHGALALEKVPTCPTCRSTDLGDVSARSERPGSAVVCRRCGGYYNLKMEGG